MESVWHPHIAQSDQGKAVTDRHQEHDAVVSIDKGAEKICFMSCFALYSPQHSSLEENTNIRFLLIFLIVFKFRKIKVTSHWNHFLFHTLENEQNV
jgi:hypothetical protein